MKSTKQNTKNLSSLKKWLIPLTGVLAVGAVAVVVGLNFPIFGNLHSGDINDADFDSLELSANNADASSAQFGATEWRDEKTLNPSEILPSNDLEALITHNKVNGISERATLQTLSSEEVYGVEDSDQPKADNREDYAKQVIDKSSDSDKEIINNLGDGKDDQGTTTDDPQSGDTQSDDPQSDEPGQSLQGTYVNPNDITRFGNSDYDKMCVMMTANFLSASADDPIEAYVVYKFDRTAQKGTLTFYYDDKKTTHTDGYVFPVPENDNELPEWRGVGDTGQTYNCYYVDFDQSLVDNHYKPTSCYGWFKSFTDQGTYTKFSHMERLDTSNCKNFTSMFDGCSFANSDLENLDIDFSNIDTSSAEKMACMFANCLYLENINLSDKFHTETATLMGGMFTGSPVINKIDATKISLQSLTSKNAYYAGVNRMFYNCTYVHDIDLSSWDTTGVATSKKYVALFDGCVGIAKLTVSSSGWKIPFHRGSGGCYLNLNGVNQIRKDITDDYYVKTNEGFLGVKVAPTAEKTTLNQQLIDELREAGIQKVEITAQDDQPYTTGYSVFYRNVLTFYNDSDIYYAKGAIYSDYSLSSTQGLLSAPWVTDNNLFNNITEIRCSDTYSSTLRPVSARALCYGMPNLKYADFSKINFCDTQILTGMFYGCSSLEKVTFISDNKNSNSFENCVIFVSMFFECSNLVSVDFPAKFGKSGASNITLTWMFYGCNKLKSFDISQPSTSPITFGKVGMDSMFTGCSALEKIDMSNIIINDEPTITAAFQNCKSINEIKLPQNILTQIFNLRNVDFPESNNDIPEYIYSVTLKSSSLAPFYGAVINCDLTIPEQTRDIDGFDYVFYGATINGTLDLSKVNLTKCESYIATFAQATIDKLILPENCGDSTEYANLMFYGFKSNSDDVFNLNAFWPGSLHHATAMMTDMKVKNVYLPQWYFGAQNIFIVDNEKSSDNSDDVAKSNTNSTSVDNQENAAIGEGAVLDLRTVEHLYPFSGNETLVTIDIGDAMLCYDWYEGRRPALSNMFKNCTNLTTVYATSIASFNNSDLLKTTDVFTGCPKLTGGAGTTIHNSIDRGVSANDLTGFAIDGYPDGLAGFLTARPNTHMVKFEYNALKDRGYTVEVTHRNEQSDYYFDWKQYKNIQYVEDGGEIEVPAEKPTYHAKYDVNLEVEYVSQHFIGWYTTPDFQPGTEVELGSWITDITEDITLYAKTEMNETVRIDFSDARLPHADNTYTLPDPVLANVIVERDQHGQVITRTPEKLYIPDICKANPNFRDGTGTIYRFVDWFGYCDDPYWIGTLKYDENGNPPYIETTGYTILWAEMDPIYIIEEVISGDVISTPSSGVGYGFVWDPVEKKFFNENSYKGISLARCNLKMKYVGPQTDNVFENALIFDIKGSFGGYVKSSLAIRDFEGSNILAAYYKDLNELYPDYYDEGTYGFVWSDYGEGQQEYPFAYDDSWDGKLSADGRTNLGFAPSNRLLISPNYFYSTGNNEFYVEMIYSKLSPYSYFSDSVDVSYTTVIDEIEAYLD